MKRFVVLGVAAGMLLILSLFAGVVRRNHEAAESLSPSTLNTGRYGTAAAYRYVDELGFRQIRWGRPLHMLRSTEDILIVCSPLRRQVSLREAHALHDWIAEGGVLLYFRGADPFESRLTEALDGLVGLEVRRDDGLAWARAWHALSDATGTTSFGVPSRYATRAQRLVVEAGAQLPDVADDAALLPLFVYRGHPVVVARDIGRGRAIVVASVAPIRRDGLADGDNAAFLLSVLDAHRRAGAIAWDEYHHGYSERYPLAHVLSRPEMTALLLQLAAISGLYLWSRGRRFGTPMRLIGQSRRTLHEFVVSLAGLYARSGDNRAVLRAIFTRQRRALHAWLGLPDMADHRALANALQQRRLPDAEEIAATLQRIQGLTARPRLSNGALLRAVRSLHRIAQRVRRETW